MCVVLNQNPPESCRVGHVTAINRHKYAPAKEATQSHHMSALYSICLFYALFIVITLHLISLLLPFHLADL